MGNVGPDSPRLAHGDNPDCCYLVIVPHVCLFQPATRRIALRARTGAQSHSHAWRLQRQRRYFGGWVMAQVDLAGSVLPARYVQGRMATVAVNEFIFKQPVRVGDILSFFSPSRAWVTPRSPCRSRCMPSACQGRYVKVTEATLTYVAIDANGARARCPNRGACPGLKAPAGQLNPQAAMAAGSPTRTTAGAADARGQPKRLTHFDLARQLPALFHHQLAVRILPLTLPVL